MDEEEEDDPFCYLKGRDGTHPTLPTQLNLHRPSLIPRSQQQRKQGNNNIVVPCWAGHLTSLQTDWFTVWNITELRSKSKNWSTYPAVLISLIVSMRHAIPNVNLKSLQYKPSYSSKQRQKRNICCPYNRNRPPVLVSILQLACISFSGQRLLVTFPVWVLSGQLDSLA